MGKIRKVIKVKDQGKLPLHSKYWEFMIIGSKQDTNATHINGKNHGFFKFISKMNLK